MGGKLSVPGKSLHVCSRLTAPQPSGPRPLRQSSVKEVARPPPHESTGSVESSPLAAAGPFLDYHQTRHGSQSLTGAASFPSQLSITQWDLFSFYLPKGHIGDLGLIGKGHPRI